VLGKTHTVGPTFFKGTVLNGTSYLEMLENFFIRGLICLKHTHSTDFKQGGALATLIIAFDIL
jgi:hypothetical protein